MHRSPTLETISDVEQDVALTGIGQDIVVEQYIETSCRYFTTEEQTFDAKMMNLFWYHKLQWIVYDISLNLCMTFTIFALIYDPKVIFVGDAKGRLLRIHTYGLMSLFLFIDLLINSIPVRVLHLAFPLAISVVYFLVSLVLTLAYGRSVRLFPEINCNNEQCLVQMAIVLGVGSPAVHLVFCAINCAKNRIALCLSRTKQTARNAAGSRKVSRCSRASDSTAMATLSSYRTYSAKV